MLASTRFTTFCFMALAVAACVVAPDEDDVDTASTESAATRLELEPIEPIDIRWPVRCPVYRFPWVAGAPVVGDGNTDDDLRRESDLFWWNYFPKSDQEEVDDIAASIAQNNPPYWRVGYRVAALVQMYDRLAPVDAGRATVYLERLRRIADVLLAYRDDKRHAPVDPFRGQVMPAWGAYTPNRDGLWNTDVVTAGLFTYPMAAFARRVAANPGAFCPKYQQDAIRFMTATAETYLAFRPEMHLTDSDPWAYFTLPPKYADLLCVNGASGCSGYRAGANKAISWNENLSMMKTLAEAAIAADSELYRSTPDTIVKAFALWALTAEAPRLIAKNVAFFRAHLDARVHTLSDGAQYYLWNHQYALSPRIQDTAHAQFEIGSLVSIYENRVQLDGLIARQSRPERIGLSTVVFTRLANTFLRRIWQYDFANPNGVRNVLSKNVDGSGDRSVAKNSNEECAGFVALAQFDPWVWRRCRDTTFNLEGDAREDNVAALLRYR